MTEKKLVDRLEKFIEEKLPTALRWDVKIELENIIEIINTEWLTKNKKIFNQISSKSQRWILLEYMQKNPEKEIMDIDFKNDDSLPFIGAKPWSRLSELKSMWLVNVVDIKKATMTFEKKCRNSYVYQINQTWLNYILKN